MLNSTLNLTFGLNKYFIMILDFQFLNINETETGINIIIPKDYLKEFNSSENKSLVINGVDGEDALIYANEYKVSDNGDNYSVEIEYGYFDYTKDQDEIRNIIMKNS